MLEDELSGEGDLRFEDRDSISFTIGSTTQLSTSQMKSGIGSVVRLIIFGQAGQTSSCHRIFTRISITTIGNYKNVSDINENDPNQMINGLRRLSPFHEANEFISPIWHHFNTEGTQPERRECFARYKWIE